MAVSNAPVAPIGGRQSTFDSLRLGRGSQFVIGRLLRFWDSRNIKKHGEFMGITMVLLDELDDVIHAFIPAGRASHYRASLKAGSVVKLERFEVARSTQTYKITENQFAIRFIPATTIVELDIGAPVINLQKFMIRPLGDLQILANTNLEFPDVVGQIRSVQGSDLHNEASTTRIVVRLLLDTNATVYLSLWDEAASIFRVHLMGGDKSQSMIVVTTVNPKIFGGSLYLNSTPGTKFYFDSELPEVKKLCSRLGGPTNEEFPCVYTKEGLRKKEIVTIGDLNSFISNSNEQSQEADFLCKARIIEVLQENGWNFISCTGCNRKLEKSGTSFRCNRCLTDDVTGVIRYRVELAVDDGNDCATFVVFDKEMSKLTQKDAATLALEGDVPNGVHEQLPSCLDELSGKEYVFQIRVTPYNFTPNHRTFTVSTISEDLIKGNDPKADNEESLQPADETGCLSRAASSRTLTDTELGAEDNSSNPPGCEERQRNLKRRRE